MLLRRSSLRLASIASVACLTFIASGCGSEKQLAEQAEAEEEMFESSDYEAEMMGGGEAKKK